MLERGIEWPNVMGRGTNRRLEAAHVPVRLLLVPHALRDVTNFILDGTIFRVVLRTGNDGEPARTGWFE